MNIRPARSAGVGFALVLLLGSVTMATGQVNLGGSAGGGGGGGAYALEEDERNLKLAGVPIPGYSEVLGVNLGVVAMAFYKMDRNDPHLPPSSTGVFGFYSANNSWMGGAFQKFHLDGDNWRATAAGGFGSVKYQFNPAAIDPGFPDIFLDYTTATNFLFAQGSRRVYQTFYLGLAAVTWSAQVRLEPELVETEDERYSGPGIVGEWDRRDHIMYPTDGWFVEGRYLIYNDAFGSDRDFQALKLSVSDYWAVADTTHIVAGRVLTQTSNGDVPFSAQNILSGNQNLRGYSNGRYRGDKLLTVEAEWRWNFWGRWGAAAFAGVGWVADEFSAMTLDDSLPAAGLGLRFRMIEAYKINARVDYAWGKHDQALYIAIGEHF